MGAQHTIDLLAMSEDVLIYTVSFLEPPEILCLSATCKTLHTLASLRIVWTNACNFHVKGLGYPFPATSTSALDNIPTDELTFATIHAWSLAKRWITGFSGPRRVKYISGTSGTLVSDVKFMPGRKGKLVVTISKVIWSALTVWSLGGSAPDGGMADGEEGSRKVCEWSPRGAIFTGYVVNEDEKSPATFALSVHLNEEQSVKVLKLSFAENASYSLEELYSVDTDMKPITLAGDLLALSNDVSQTAIWNWREGTYAILEHSTDGPSIFQSNECHQIVFAHQSVLVARARSIHLFPFPELKHPTPGAEPLPPYPAIASHSFGWVDGQSVAICPFLDKSLESGAVDRPSWQPLSILVRGESDDPWSSDVHNLELYALDPNPNFMSSSEVSNSAALQEGPGHEQNYDVTPPPYIFPPRLSNKTPCLRGSLRCKKIILGRFGTAVWIQPRDRFPGGLLADIPWHMIPPTDTHESIVVTVFPGSLSPESSRSGRRRDGVVVGRKIFGNELNTSWTSIDYDEVGGRIALVSSFGRVVILEL
ncbi:hypothetical protein CPB84DRAFT_1854131 [Gymnopilus junonius]|uniref:F-box domain-containing protein n=1 Tax=Gymnopilus junonius TaxID=109634 RepID=A0A9P5N7T3_GYMJU|nr:hypothetical protein CPB84DRAFT_1854131 [Gymnopilus junonius]